MRGVRTQYFLAFAVLGTVLPYVPVYFRDAGLTKAQVGYAFAVWSAASILSPVLVAWAADARVDPRRLVLACAAATGAALAGLGFVRGAGAVFAVWVVYCLVSIPLLPLLDGIYFSLQRRRAAEGLPPEAYHRVRVWGTIGYIVPSVLLFGLFVLGLPVAWAVPSGAAFAVLTGVQAMLLPDPHAAADPAAVKSARGRLPTVAAAQVLLQPQILVFCAVLFVGQMASYALAAFYPIYLTERVGLAAKWVGVIANLGVAVEVLFVLAAGRLAGRLGVRGLLVLGMALTGGRMALLALFATPAIGVGTQVVHGILVVVLGVLPQPFLNRHADDDCRHSVQGLFVMLMGFGKVAGSLAAGRASEVGGVEAAFALGAVLCVAGAALAATAFRETPAPATTPPPPRPQAEAAGA